MRATFEQIKPVAEQIKTGWELCGFAGKSEIEALVCQTLRGALCNGKGAYSIKELSRDRAGLAENTASYKACLNRGWFDEEQVDGEIRIYPTIELVEKVAIHLGG